MKKLLPDALPLLCSFAAVLLSAQAVLLATKGFTELSFGVVLIATWFDFLDGALARQLKVETAFGSLVDLLQDVINYLIYPLVVFAHEPMIVVMLLPLFVVCGVYRLARFHSEGFTNKGQALWYKGMPVYMNHVLVLVYITLLATPYQVAWLVFSLPLVSILMVSSVPFPKPRSILPWSTLLILLSFWFLL